jgi:hypothetical protein
LNILIILYSYICNAFFEYFDFTFNSSNVRKTVYFSVGNFFLLGRIEDVNFKRKTGKGAVASGGSSFIAQLNNIWDPDELLTKHQLETLNVYLSDIFRETKKELLIGLLNDTDKDFTPVKFARDCLNKYEAKQVVRDSLLILVDKKNKEIACHSGWRIKRLISFGFCSNLKRTLAPLFSSGKVQEVCLIYFVKFCIRH